MMLNRRFSVAADKVWLNTVYRKIFKGFETLHIQIIAVDKKQMFKTACIPQFCFISGSLKSVVVVITVSIYYKFFVFKLIIMIYIKLIRNTVYYNINKFFSSHFTSSAYMPGINYLPELLRSESTLLK